MVAFSGPGQMPQGPRIFIAVHSLKLGFRECGGKRWMRAGVVLFNIPLLITHLGSVLNKMYEGYNNACKCLMHNDAICDNSAATKSNHEIFDMLGML